MMAKEKEIIVHDDESEWVIVMIWKENKWDQHYKLKKVWVKTPNAVREDGESNPH